MNRVQSSFQKGPWWLRQGGATLIGILVLVVFHLGPASSSEIKFAAKARLPACSVSVPIQYVADADDLFGVRTGTSGQDGSGDDGGERQSDAMHPAWDVNWWRNFFVVKLNFARKHGGLGEVENTASYSRHHGVGITGIDVSETYRNRIGVGHAPGESRAKDGNSWPMSRDEFSIAEFGSLLGSGNTSHQLNALPTEYEKLEKSDNGKSYGGPKKTFGEEGEPPVIICLFVLTAAIGSSLFLTLFGWQNFYNNRRLLGASFIGLGCLVGLSGLGWWWSWLL